MIRYKSRIIWLLIIFAGCLAFRVPAFAQEVEPDEPVVQAVLFYSPTCPHCHDVITNFLVPLLDEYDTQLDVLGIDASTQAGSLLYNNAIIFFEISENRLGVPTLIYQDTVLVGGSEIPNEFPGLVEAGLAAGGVGWPEIPGLAEVFMDLAPSAASATPEVVIPMALPTAEAAATGVAEMETAVPSLLAAENQSTATATPTASQFADTAAQPLNTIDTTAMKDAEAAPPPDPVGFALGWAVLLGQSIILLFGVWQLGGHWTTFINGNTALNQVLGRNRLMWLLIVVGLIVSGYLAYVEMMQVTAVCGPIGECNIVQSSPYAQILGIPIAVLGLLFYLAVIVLWLLQRVEKARHLAVVSLVGLTFFGSLFSLYLTLLEMLVIGAICAWCLTSAVVTGSVFLLVTMGALKRPFPPTPQLSTG